MPDDELLRLEFAGQLHPEAELKKQVKRMLASEKSRAFVQNFFGQWLELRSLDIRTPDRTIYTTFNERLRQAMRTETGLFVESILKEDRSVLELLDADYTFVNERLAQHYGIKNITGDQFQRVSLQGTERGGILTQASILTITSNPTRTSPVKRGKWILENILGTPPPPAPGNVPELEQQKQLTGTLRERMEQHRTNPTCAVCHKQMDALGFAFENFDGVGRWRTADGEGKVNAAGTLPTGEEFTGPGELRKILLKTKKEDFVRCLAEKMLTYALGRGLEYYDKCAVDKIVEATRKDDYRISALVQAIVLSDPFLKKGALRPTP